MSEAVAIHRRRALLNDPNLLWGAGAFLIIPRWFALLAIGGFVYDCWYGGAHRACRRPQSGHGRRGRTSPLWRLPFP